MISRKHNAQNINNSAHLKLKQTFKQVINLENMIQKLQLN